jgi:hypothetical protein
MTSRHLASSQRRRPAERRGWKRLHLPANGDLLQEVKRLQDNGLVFDFDSHNRLIVPNAYTSVRRHISLPKNSWMFLAIPGVLIGVSVWPSQTPDLVAPSKPQIHKVQCVDEVQKLAVAKTKPGQWVKFGGVQLQQVTVSCESRSFHLQVIKSSKTLRAIRLD